LVGVALSIISNFQWWVPILKVNFGPTTGNSAFAESPGLCREPSKKLSAKKALPRAPKKNLEKEETLDKAASLPRAKKTLRKKETLNNEERLGKEASLPRALLRLTAKNFFNNHFLRSKLFVFSIYTYTKLMLKFGTILALYAIFKNFTSF
jgi:hypothetical protein